jgi:hypothetical protein
MRIAQYFRANKYRCLEYSACVCRSSLQGLGTKIVDDLIASLIRSTQETRSASHPQNNVLWNATIFLLKILENIFPGVP